jgi:hypothetical protein
MFLIFAPFRRAGDIPGSLGQLGLLQDLRLDENQFSGQFLYVFFEVLVPHRHSLSTPCFPSCLGSIPPEFGQLSSLQVLFLYDTPLSGL